MSQAKKLKNNDYIDSSSIVHNRATLNNLMYPSIVQLIRNAYGGYTLDTLTQVTFTSNNVIGTHLTQTSNKRIVVNSDKVQGVLLFAHADYQTSTSTTTAGRIEIQKNGTRVCLSRFSRVNSQYGAGATGIGAFYVPVEKGDYFEMFYQMSGGAGTFGCYNSFTGVWLTAIAILK